MHYNCLIVDDEKELAENTSEYFNMFDVSTEYVTEASDCLAFLEKNSVDLILLDINLGGASGFELCKKLRESLDVPIIFISARSSDDDVLIALNIGGDDYIKKPYTLSVVLAKVRVVLKRYQNTVSKHTEDNYENENLRVDYKLGKIFVNKKEVLLNHNGFKIKVQIRNSHLKSQIVKIHSKNRFILSVKMVVNLLINEIKILVYPSKITILPIVKTLENLNVIL